MQKKKSRLWVVLGGGVLLAVVASLTACTFSAPYNMPMEVTKLQLKAGEAKPGAPVQGKDCKFVIFGLQFSAPSILEAEKQALKEYGGSKMLTQKTVYGGVENNFGIFYDRCWYVEGRVLDMGN